MIGQTISHYKITAKIGEGGMGVVYKAIDNTLDRAVALKFLAPNLTSDEDSRERLVREAKAAAALSHPNICRIFEIGESSEQIFLVLEFVEGERLDKKIERGPMPIDEAISIGLQIARALDAAHKKGVVHRDIKSSNIIISNEGHATLMDFGLAQLAERSRLTRHNMTLGTAPYMSPEQAKGGGTDQRTDIWSLGVVLYEMTTGRLPFRGDFDQAIIYSIQNAPPEPITALRSGLPMHLEWIIEKALSKDRDDRYPRAEELAVDLRSLQKRFVSGQVRIAPPSGGLRGGWDTGISGSGEMYSARTESQRPVSRGTQIGPPENPPSQITGQRPSAERRLKQALLVTLAMLAAALGTIAWPYLRGPGRVPELPLRKFTISTTEDADGAVISPNGSHIAYLSGLTTIAARGLPSGAETRLWLAELETNTTRLLEGTEGASYPFWSPDGEFIGFRAGRDLKKISIYGGAPILVCRLATQASGSGTWSPDGRTIVFESFNPTGLYSVPSQGGDPEPLLTPEDPAGTLITSPQFLPARGGAAAILYDTGTQTERQIVVHNLATKERRVLTAGAFPVYSPSGHILFQSGPRTPGLWAVRFSLDTLTTEGERFSIDSAAQGPSVSRDGTLAYVSALTSPQQLIWRDRRGNKIEVIGQPQSRIIDPALSPDGKLVAVRAWETKADASDIWIHDLTAAGTKRRLTFDPADETGPIWKPSGREVTYLSRKSGNLDILSKRLDSGSEAATLVATPLNEFADDWSHDEKYLVYTSAADETHADLWYLRPAANGGGYEQAPLLRTPARELVAKFSRDGRHLAYCSNESGRYEVYVQSFPDGNQRYQVSFDGGTQPRWSPDGKELFYVNDDELLAVSVSTNGGFTAGRTRPLFRDSNLQNGFPIPTYDVSPDGQRFVMVETLGVRQGRRGAIQVSQNWFAAFRGRGTRGN